MSHVVGIDLGTTNSLVAWVRDGEPTVIPDPRRASVLLPSVVFVDDRGNVQVGREAARRLLTDAGHTVYSVKRFMGRGADDVTGEASATSRSGWQGRARASCGSASASGPSRRPRSRPSSCAS